MADKGVGFTFSFDIKYIIRPDTGECFVLPSDAQIDEDYGVQIDRMNDDLAGKRIEQGITEADQADEKAKRIKDLEYWRDDRRRRRDVAQDSPLVQTISGNLVKPDWREDKALRAKYTKRNEDFEASFDAEGMIDELLPKSVQGVSLDDLDLRVVTELGRRLYRSLFPDERMLPFTCPAYWRTTPDTPKQ